MFEAVGWPVPYSKSKFHLLRRPILIHHQNERLGECLRASVGPCHGGLGSGAPGGFQAAVDRHRHCHRSPFCLLRLPLSQPTTVEQGGSPLVTTNSQVYRHSPTKLRASTININQTERRKQRHMTELLHKLEAFCQICR